MKHTIKPIVYITAGALSVMVVTFILLYSKLPPQIPLFYSRPEGDSQIADLPVMATIPILTVAVVALNEALLKKFFKNSHFIRTCLQYVNVSIVIGFTLIFMKLLSLVS